MCGIAGCFGVKDTETVSKMLDALPHRGPDDRGMHTFNNTVLKSFDSSILRTRYSVPLASGLASTSLRKENTCRVP